MTNEEIARRLRFIVSFVTTERASVNRIIRVEGDAVWIAAESTGHERRISFADILTRNTSNQSAIDALRQILGLD